MSSSGFAGRAMGMNGASPSALAMRLLSLAAVVTVLTIAAPASAQEAPAPDPQSTYVAPAHSGEALRVTTYVQRPQATGRLAQRYKGLRANRSAPTASPQLVRPRPVARTYSSPRASFIRIGGSFFQVVPR